MKLSRLNALATVGVAALLLAACGAGTQISSGNSPTKATPAVTPQAAANTLKVEKAGFGGKVSSGIPFWTAGAFLLRQKMRPFSTAVHQPHSNAV